MMLAQITAPTSLEFAGWLGCLVAAVFLVDRLLRFYKDHMREQPRPDETYVTNDHCQLVHQKHEDRVRELRAELMSLIERNRGEVAEIKSSITRVHERLDELETRVGELPDRVVALLMNTKRVFDHQTGPR